MLDAGQPRIGEPELALIAGMAAPLPNPPAPAASSPQTPIVSQFGVNIPDTSGPPPTPPGLELQEPGSWVYDFDPASGMSRATFNGEIAYYTGPGGAPVTSFNGRSGAITLTTADLTGAGGATAAGVAASYLPLTGGTLTGNLSVPGTGPGAGSVTATTVIAGEASGYGGPVTLGPTTIAGQTVNSVNIDNEFQIYADPANGNRLTIRTFGGALLAYMDASGDFNIAESFTAGANLQANADLHVLGSAYVPGSGIGARPLYDASGMPPVWGYFANGAWWNPTSLSIDVALTGMAANYAQGSVTWSTTASDRRLKRDIRVPDLDALGVVERIAIWACDYLPAKPAGEGAEGLASRGARPQPWPFSFMADEVAEVLPFAAILQDGHWVALHPTHLCAVLWRATQQLHDRIRRLERTAL